MQEQGKIFVAAALAAGGALLLSRQMRSMSPASAWVAERAIEGEGRRRPGGLGAVAALTIGGLLLSRQLKKARQLGFQSTVNESIEVEVPLSTAYNQWIQFEEFPRFMESVQEVTRLDNTHLHWRANFAGKTKEWDAEITEQIPDERIAWRSTGGVSNAGVVRANAWRDTDFDTRPQNAHKPTGKIVDGRWLPVGAMVKDLDLLKLERGTGARRILKNVGDRFAPGREPRPSQIGLPQPSDI